MHNIIRDLADLQSGAHDLKIEDTHVLAIFAGCLFKEAERRPELREAALAYLDQHKVELDDGFNLFPWVDHG